MGTQRLKARGYDQPEPYHRGDSDNGTLLDGADLLGCLESDHPAVGDPADRGDPVIGIAFGLMVGGLFWAVAIAAYFIVT